MRDEKARGAVLLPWIALALAFSWSLWLVGRYGANIPRSDEWRDLSVILGDEPLTFDWIWTPHSVHRIPLPRLVRLVLYRLSGGDFRSALFFNVGVMAVATVFMLLAASRCRGAPSKVDVFFPLLLLGPAHYMNFLWAFQVQFALSAALFLAALALVASLSGAPTPRGISWLALALALQVLTGANGLALALPLIVWGVVAVAHATFERRLYRVAPAMLVSLAVLLAGLYPVGLALDAPVATAPAAVLRTAVQFLSTSLVAAVPLWRGRAVFILLLAASALLVLVRAFHRIPGEKWRASGLAASGIAMFLLAAFVGFGRAEFTTDAGIQDRYATLAAPLLCLIYLCFLLYGGDRSRRAVPIALLAATLLATPLTTMHALLYGELRRAELARLQQDVDRGLPLDAIAARNGSAVYPFTAAVPHYLSRLVAHRAWPFERYETDPGVRTRVVKRKELPLDSAEIRDLLLREGTLRPSGPTPRLVLRFPEKVPVAGLELRFTMTAPRDRLVRLEVHWNLSGDADVAFRPGEDTATFPVFAEPGPRSLTAFLFDDIDALRIDLDPTGRFEIQKLTLLVMAPDWLPAGAVRPGPR
jgi:hypothetical protein